MRHTVRRHRLALLLAIFVSAIYGSPHVFVSRELASRGLAYEPITIAGDRDEGAFYGVRAAAVYRGQWLAGDVNVSGNEQSPSLLPLANPVILGGLGRMLGSLKAGFIASDFLFPPLIFLTLYLIAFEFTRRTLLSAWFASTFIFMPKLFLVSGFARELLPDLANRLYFSRFEYPKITFLFFALALYLILRALTRNEKRTPLIAGASFGLTFYTYLYDWAYILVGLGLLFVFFLLQKNYTAVRRLLLVIGVGFLTSIFYWVNFFELRGLPQYGDLVSRIGVEVSHSFRWTTAWKSYLRAAALAAFAWWSLRKSNRAAATYLASFLLVIAVVLNIQVVLGFNPQPDHWHRIQFFAVGVGMLTLIHWLLQKYFRGVSARVGALAGSVLILLVFGKTAYAQYAYSVANIDRYVIPAARAESYAWLNEHAPPGSVVGSTGLANSELPLYTHMKLLAPNGFNTTVSDAELWDRFMVAARIFEVRMEEFKVLIRESDVLLYLFHDEYRDRSFDSYFRTSGRALPEAVAAWAEARYTEYLELPTTYAVQKYRLDYLYVAEGTHGTDPNKVLLELRTVYSRNGITIYEVST